MRQVIYGFCFFILYSYKSFGQNTPLDFNQYAKQMEETYKPGVKGYKHWKRKEYILKPRHYNNANVGNMTLRNLQAMQEWKSSDNISSRSTHGSWIFQGPNQSTTGLGRLNCVTIDPNNSNTIYVGASSGGVWKSTNGGSTWNNISHHLPLLAVADIVVNPSNSNELYLLTGEGDAQVDNNNINGYYTTIGVLISQDGGNNWYPTATAFTFANNIVPHKLLVDPSDANIQFIATESGILRTQDKWQTFTNELNALIFDIEFNPFDHDEMYASSDSVIYRSFNNGLDWTVVNDATFAPLGSGSRIELAVTPSGPTSVFMIGGNFNNGMQIVAWSAVNGASGTWSVMNSTFTGMGTLAPYCIALEVSPTDISKLYGGLQWICKSTDVGANWNSIVQNSVHADVHDIAIDGANLYVACDGGLYKSVDEGANWTELSAGLEITEIYKIAGTPQNTNLYFMGTQDNGTKRKNSASQNFGDQLGSDGMVCQINPINSNIVYASKQNGSLWWSTNGGNTFFQYSTGDGGWVTPYQLDNSNYAKMLIGYKDVFSVDLNTFAWTSLQFPAQNNFLDCLAQGVSGTSRVYASYKDSIYRTNIGTGVWTYIGDGLPDLWITDIEVNPNDSSEIFVTLSTYTGGQKVYKSINGGNTWINISGNLPNVPANCIAYHDNGLNNDALYVGTDIGIFYKDNSMGNNWIYFSNYLPSVRIADLYINTADNTISAGTFGRGLWKSSLYDGCQNDLVLTSDGGGVRYFSANNYIYSVSPHFFDFNNDINYKAGDNIVLAPGFEIGGNAEFEAKIGPCPEEFNNFNSTNNYTAKGELILNDEMLDLLKRY